ELVPPQLLPEVGSEGVDRFGDGHIVAHRRRKCPGATHGFLWLRQIFALDGQLPAELPNRALYRNAVELANEFNITVGQLLCVRNATGLQMGCQPGADTPYITDLCNSQQLA